MIVKLRPEELSLSSTIACAKAFFAESLLPGELNIKHWQTTWGNLIRSGIGEIFAYMIDGKVVGFLGGLFYPCSMTGDMEALEGFWYMSPDHRGGVGAIRLLKAFEQEGKNRGAKRVKMVHLMSVNPEEVSKLYIRMGYKKLQVNYAKEL